MKANCAAVIGAVSLDHARRREPDAPEMLYATKQAGDVLQTEGNRLGKTRNEVAQDAVERTKTILNRGLTNADIKQFEACFRQLGLN